MSSGTAASTRSSRVACPTTASMRSMSPSWGPMCRSAKVVTAPLCRIGVGTVRNLRLVVDLGRRGVRLDALDRVDRGGLGLVSLGRREDVAVGRADAEAELAGLVLVDLE